MRGDTRRGGSRRTAVVAAITVAGPTSASDAGFTPLTLDAPPAGNGTAPDPSASRVAPAQLPTAPRRPRDGPAELAGAIHTWGAARSPVPGSRHVGAGAGR